MNILEQYPAFNSVKTEEQFCLLLKKMPEETILNVGDQFYRLLQLVIDETNRRYGTESVQ